MSTVYQDIASAILPVLPYFTVDGIESWIVARASGATRQVHSVGAFTGYIVRNEVDKALLSLPQTSIYTAPWLLLAPLGQSITPQTEDILIGSDDRVFAIVGAPQDDFAMWFIPLSPEQRAPGDIAIAPLVGGAGVGMRIGLRIGLS